jgi:hypothetical protein
VAGDAGSHLRIASLGEPSEQRDANGPSVEIPVGAHARFSEFLRGLLVGVGMPIRDVSGDREALGVLE